MGSNRQGRDKAGDPETRRADCGNLFARLKQEKTIMKTILMSLLLAAGVSCAPAPPFEPEPVPTTTTTQPIIETTTLIQVEKEITTQAQSEEISTQQKKDTSIPTVTSVEITTLEPEEELSEKVTTVIPDESKVTPAAEEIISPTTDSATPTTVAPTTTATTTTVPPTPDPTQAPRIPAKERESLISHLGNVDLTNVDKLVLTPRQRLAIEQELEYQSLGLAPYTDPTPWQRLSRDQQEEFNRKYLALRSDLQEYSRNQFLSLPEDRQEHAYNAFLSLDIETLSQVIDSELEKEREALEAVRIAEERERQRLDEEKRQQQEAQRIRNIQQQQTNNFPEQPRSQQGNTFQGFDFNQIGQRNVQFKQRPRFDPRRIQQPARQNQFQQRHFQQQLQNHNQFQQQLSAAERLHFQQADAQLQEAIRLQGCLANPSACS